MDSARLIAKQTYKKLPKIDLDEPLEDEVDQDETEQDQPLQN